MQYLFTNQIKSIFAGAVVVASLTAPMLRSANAATADQGVTAVSTPTIKVALEPYSPNGAMRLYTVAGGTSYWTQDMPVNQGDSAKLDVFVATGANDLEQLKIRLDNTLMASINAAPWTTTIPASQLTPGYHFIETWAQVSGAKPKSPQFVTNNFTFFVQPAAPESAMAIPTPITTAPVTAVKGQEQILNNGQVTTISLDNTPVLPSVPVVLQGADTDSKATVKVAINDEATNNLLTSINGDPVSISLPVIVSVIVPAGSAAQNFVYTIERGDQPIETAGKLYPADATHLRLQPRTQSSPGMLDGIATLWVWGVDAHGNYGKPIATQINIVNAFGG